MRVITRQLAKEILFSSGFVLIALVALFAFFDLVGQLDDVADGRDGRPCIGHHSRRDGYRAAGQADGTPVARVSELCAGR